MVNKTWISFFSLKYCFFQLQWETFSRWIQHLYSDIRRSCVHLASFIPSNVPFTSICLAVLVWYRMADWIAIARAWSNEIRIILRWLMFDEEKGRWCSFLGLRSNFLERRNVRRAGSLIAMYQEFVVCNVPGKCSSKHRELNNILLQVCKHMARRTYCACKKRIRIHGIWHWSSFLGLRSIVLNEEMYTRQHWILVSNQISRTKATDIKLFFTY